MSIGPIEQRRNYELIKAMHTVVMYFNDEDAIMPWFYAYPDGADDEELMEMAGDIESMDFIAGSFRRRVAQGGKSGWHTQPMSEFSEWFDRKSAGDDEPAHVYGAKED